MARLTQQQPLQQQTPAVSAPVSTVAPVAQIVAVRAGFLWGLLLRMSSRNMPANRLSGSMPIEVQSWSNDTIDRMLSPDGRYLMESQWVFIDRTNIRPSQSRLTLRDARTNALIWEKVHFLWNGTQAQVLSASNGSQLWADGRSLIEMASKTNQREGPSHTLRRWDLSRVLPK
jgi:hypothetical protein